MLHRHMNHTLTHTHTHWHKHINTWASTLLLFNVSHLFRFFVWVFARIVCINIATVLICVCKHTFVSHFNSFGRQTPIYKMDFQFLKYPIFVVPHINICVYACIMYRYNSTFAYHIVLNSLVGPNFSSTWYISRIYE